MASGAISEYFETQNGNGQAYGRKFAAFLAREFPGLRPDLSFSLPIRRVGERGMRAMQPSRRQKPFQHPLFRRGLCGPAGGRSCPSCKAGKRCINIQYGDEQAPAAVQKTVKAFLGELTA